MKRIYLDHAATTYTDPQVIKAMLPYFDKYYGNPSTIYHEGRTAKSALETARARTAKILGAKPAEIVFPSGITESDNLALLGVARASKSQGKHIITTNIEHSAILASVNRLEKEGFKVTYLPNDKYGLIDPKNLKKAIRKDTILISIIYAHNEIGTIEPIEKFSKIIKEAEKKLKNRIYFHTDAAQAPGLLPININKLGVDLMTFGGSKIYGPKGIAVLYVKDNVVIEPIMFGGHHEAGLVPGTENVPGTVGLAKALTLVEKKRLKEAKRLTTLRDYLIKKIQTKIPRVYLNGHPIKRLPNNINFSFKGVEGESLILQLDKYGIATSTGSACSSGNLKPSATLLALKMPQELAHGSLRITLGKKTTKKNIDYFINSLIKVVNKLRLISAIK